VPVGAQLRAVPRPSFHPVYMNPRSPRHTPARPATAAHRPASVTIPAAAPINFAPNAALLIDFDNVTMGIRSDLQTELKTLLSSDIIKGKVQLRRAYADWRRYPQYVAPLAESSIDMIMAPAYGSSKKNATDIRLAIDALELVFTRPEIGTYILLSGDSDFSTLVIKLKEYGKYVIGVGLRESSSDLLVMNCDEYFSYNSLAGLVRSDEEDQSGTRRDPWELVSEAIARMQRNGDVMRADRLKQVMQGIDSSFDEKNLGMSKFSRFVQEAAHRGLVTLTKMDNGQLEVAPPAGGAPAAATGEHPVHAPSHSAAHPPAARPAGGHAGGAAGEARAEDRPRRSRRGGRGRGRDREGRPGREPHSAVVGHVGTGAPGEEVVVAAEGATDAPAAEAPAVRHEAPRHAEQPVIGASGERLTRDEAFDLVRRAVAALVGGDTAVLASDVRAKAAELLGRDSDSLSERNFSRILRDAHDADVIDIRRRGDDYDVALATTAPPVAEQLNVAAGARTGASGPAPAAAPAAPRGLGPRGSKRGSFGGRGTLPPELLSVGVVDSPVGEAVVAAGVPVEEVEEVEEPAARTRPAAAKRPRARAKRARAADTGASAAAAPASKAKRGRARGPAKVPAKTDG
jgi:uncharacterized LabA/DUF88 family protein